MGTFCVGAGDGSVSVGDMVAVRVGSVSVGTVYVEAVRFELSVMLLLKLWLLSVLEQLLLRSTIPVALQLIN